MNIETDDMDIHTDAELNAAYRATVAEIRALLGHKRALAAEREARAQRAALAVDLKRLRGKYGAQTLTAGGIGSAEQIGQAGA